MPSLGEAPSGGAQRFLVTFLGVCKKVTRRKGGTLSSRYRSNGYALNLPKRPTGSEQHKELRRYLGHRSQASSHNESSVRAKTLCNMLLSHAGH